MPPKKGKKNNKNDDDYWEKKGVSVVEHDIFAQTDLADQNEISSFKAASKATEFAVLLNAGNSIEEEDFGGLMSTLKANAKKKEKKIKNKDKRVDIDEGFDGIPAGEGADAHSNLEQPAQVTADDLVDEEWGPVKEKGKKNKKGKKKDKRLDQEEEAEELVDTKSSPEITIREEKASTTAPAEKAQESNGVDEEEPTTKVLSKKEKERLKKEREKAKKKIQATAKKTAGSGDEEERSRPAEVSAHTPAKILVHKDDGENQQGEEGPADVGSGKADKKKKKKKPKKDEEPTPAPSKARGIGVLKAMMEEKKRLEEEARRKAEEEERRLEEERQKAEEEERKKEEERQRRKEKEKAKRELARREGRLLTKKQKEERALAEKRKQIFLASGVQIEALQQNEGAGPSSPVPKRVVYGNKKKKGPNAKEVPSASQLRPNISEPVVAKIERDEWDASSDEGIGKTPPPTVGTDGGAESDWDVSSGDGASEGVKKATLTKNEPTETNTKVPVAAKTPAKGKIAPNPKEVSPSSGSGESSDSDSSCSDSDSSEESSSEDEELSQAKKIAAQRKAEAAARKAKAHEEALAARNKDDLRSPICCILGHVDTGKTKLLDKIRQTNVQEGEAGGITQQIGATYFPLEAIKTKTAVMNKDGTQDYRIPGLLVIDTPGHESFTNLRSRGSSLCNIAILVVDIMHGLEAQTLESLRLLRDKKTPFIVALNKIDRLYGWTPIPDGAFRESLAKQARPVQREFEDRVAKTILAFAEEGLNATLYYENKNFARNVSLVPTSAISGEGVPDMIMLLVNLTQQRMSERLMYLSEVECTVLEVKVIEGLGTTIDVVLSNGILREGERIVVCGLNGPIVTQIRALLTPQPLRELRIKSAYVHHKEVKAALGVKITAPDLEKAIAGSRLLVVGPDDDEDDLKEEIMSDLQSLLNNIDKSGRGVCVQASTLGSLEALLDFLKVSKIPVSGINIGPVHKKDVMRSATMLEKARELACILCFDVPVDKEAERLAEEMGIRIFKADIIYHLFDAFTAYNQEIVEAKRRDAAPQAVWPCRLKIIAAFAKRDPIILGVDILDGTLRVGTPLAVVKTDPTTGKKEIIDLGKITSLEINHKNQEIVKKSQAGGGVAVKIEHAVYQSAKMFGRHFDDKDEILSHVTRQSIDVLKANFKADVSNEEWILIKALKPRFGIP